MQSELKVIEENHRRLKGLLRVPRRTWVDFIPLPVLIFLHKIKLAPKATEFERWQLATLIIIAELVAEAKLLMTEIRQAPTLEMLLERPDDGKYKVN